MLRQNLIILINLSIIRPGGDGMCRTHFAHFAKKRDGVAPHPRLVYVLSKDNI